MAAPTSLASKGISVTRCPDPRYANLRLRNRVTGEVRPAACRRNGYTFCGPRKALAIAQAVADARPDSGRHRDPQVRRSAGRGRTCFQTGRVDPVHGREEEYPDHQRDARRDQPTAAIHYLAERERGPNIDEEEKLEGFHTAAEWLNKRKCMPGKLSRYRERNVPSC